MKRLSPRARRLALAATVLAVVILIAAVFGNLNMAPQDAPVPAAEETKTSQAATRSTEPTRSPVSTPAPSTSNPQTPDAPESGPSESAPNPSPPPPATSIPDFGPGAAADAGPASIDQPVAPPVAVGGEASEFKGIKISVEGIVAVEGEANGIGEIGGPSVRFTLVVANSTDKPVSLTDAVVTMAAGTERAPATELSGPGVVPFPEVAAPGATVTGTFVFLVPVEQRNTVQISLSYSPDAPVALFEGPLT